MYEGTPVFAQVMSYLPLKTFQKCVDQFDGNRYTKNFSCLDQYRCMAFAQLTYRESLRDIEVCLRAQKNKLYHMGIRGRVSRSTLADANEKRSWKIYESLGQSLISEARRLYVGEDLGLDLDNTVYALDSSTIDLCLSVFPWAPFRRAKGAVKLHTLLDLRGSIPAFIHISNGKLHDVNVLDLLVPEAGAFYVMDRAYVDYSRLHGLSQSAAYFVTRAKSNTTFRRLYSQPVDKSSGILCDQTIVMTGPKTSLRYPSKLRRIKYFDAETGKKLVFLTNNFGLPAGTIADLYRHRWKVELFFKWIKQHLRIKAFFGTSENAVKTQIWIAVSVYVIITIMKQRLKIDASLYTILQVLSLTAFEKIPLIQLLTNSDYTSEHTADSKQLNLFD
jgi:hypothetical protein